MYIYIANEMSVVIYKSVFQVFVTEVILNPHLKQLIAYSLMDLLVGGGIRYMGECYTSYGLKHFLSLYD